ncbi:hypothetical protein [Algibacter lectus]|uniref:hypothetical protein n=1 Tax=Algibacter lectus TaxID=221126 RepID=UPI0026D1C521
MQDKVIDQIEDTIENSSIWEQFMGFLNYNVYTYTIKDGSGIETGVLKVKSVLLVLIILILTTYFYALHEI